MLNDEDSVEYRELILRIIAALEQQKRQVQETIRRIDRQRLSHPEQAVRLSEGRTSAERDLAKLDQDLTRVTGGVPL
jgi:hypothetical protein